MIRLFLLSGPIGAFVVWSFYKTLIDKNATEKEINDIKLGYVFVAVVALVWLILYLV
ncbi:MAG: hypothetical protein U0X76_11305 [Bacteroidia bacterium]